MTVLDNYHVNEVSKAIELNKDSEYAIQIKMTGEFGSSKWLSITAEQAIKIKEVLKG